LYLAAVPDSSQFRSTAPFVYIYDDDYYYYVYDDDYYDYYIK